MGLEHFVITHRRRNLQVDLVCVDLEARRPVTLTRNLGHAGVYLSRPLTEEQRDILLSYLSATPLAIRAEVYQVDGKYIILTETKSKEERNLLPPGWFAVPQTAKRSPRTEWLHRFDERLARDHLIELGSREVQQYDPVSGKPMFEGGRPQFGSVKMGTEYMLQHSPLRKPEFDTFVEAITGTDTDLVFRTYQSRLGGFKNLQDAEEYIENNPDVDKARNTAMALPLTHGIGYDKWQEFVVQCISTPAELERLKLLGFKFSGRSANNLDSDPAGEGSQRLIEQVLFRPLYTVRGRPPTAEEFRLLVDIVDDLTKVIDVEMIDWIPQWRGSGDIAQLTVAEKIGLRVYTREDLMLADWDDPEVEVVPVADELVGLRAVNQEFKGMLGIFGHNTRDFDHQRVHRHDRNKYASDNEREYKRWHAKWLSKHNGLEPGDDLITKVRAEIERTHAQTNELRAVHKHRGRVVDAWPPMIDMLLPYKNWRFLRTGDSVEQVCRVVKEITYGEEGSDKDGQQQNWESEEGRVINTRYAAVDGKVERKEKSEMILPTMLFASLITGLPIDRLMSVTPFKMFHAEQMKTMIMRGRPLYKEIWLRKLKQIEKDTTDALELVRAAPIAPRATTFVPDASVYYNPAIFSSQQNLYPEHWLEAHDQLKGFYPRGVGLTLLEWYTAPVLEKIVSGIKREANNWTERGRPDKASAILGFEERADVRLGKDSRLSALFSQDIQLDKQYDQLLDTVEQLRGDRFTVQADAFLIAAHEKDQPTLLGTGNVATVKDGRKMRFIAAVEDPPYLYNIKIRGNKTAKLALREELFAAVKEVRPVHYDGEIGGRWDSFAIGVNAAIKQHLHPVAYRKKRRSQPLKGQYTLLP